MKKKKGEKSMWKILKAGNFLIRPTRKHRVKKKYNRQRDKKAMERNWRDFE